MIPAILWLLALSLLASGAYAWTFKNAARWRPRARGAAWIAGPAAAAALWLLFDFSCYKLRPELMWVVVLRAWPGIEFTAAPVGVFCALLQRRILKTRPAKDRFARHNGLLLAILLIVAQYIAPIARPARPNWAEEWKDGVCLQSDGYTCGPAAATIFRLHGIDLSEREVSRQVMLSALGSTPWYLLRCLRRNGLEARLIWESTPGAIPPVPSIAAVRLLEADGTPGIRHFITILAATPETLTIGDPLGGRFTWDYAMARGSYQFTGLYIHAPAPSSAAP